MSAKGPRLKAPIGPKSGSAGAGFLAKFSLIAGVIGNLKPEGKPQHVPRPHESADALDEHDRPKYRLISKISRVEI
jgi:hypothetical protein